jgi:hypothetical protein
MSDWAWLAESENQPVGILLAAPCHGLVYMMRLCLAESNPAVGFLLLRACMRECHKRGFKGYFTHLNPMHASEGQMIPMCKKAGGFTLTIPQVMIAGSIEKAARF